MDIIDYIHTYDLEIGEREVICNVAKFDEERVIISNANLHLKECTFDSMRIYPHKRILIAILTHNEHGVKNTKYVFEYKPFGKRILLTRIGG